MARLTAHLPHPGVGLHPAPCRGVGEVGHERLDLGMEVAQLLAVEPERVEQLAVDVQLHLVPCAVAHSDRRRFAPAAQVRKLALGEVVLASDPVHDLKRALAGAAARRAGHEGDELLGLVRAGADVERLDREARVADPGEAVVPVALAADRLGERGGRRGDDGAGGAIAEALEHARAHPDEISVRALVDVVLGLPGAPALDRVGDPVGDARRPASAPARCRYSADAQRNGEAEAARPLRP